MHSRQNAAAALDEDTAAPATVKPEELAGVDSRQGVAARATPSAYLLLRSELLIGTPQIATSVLSGIPIRPFVSAPLGN